MSYVSARSAAHAPAEARNAFLVKVGALTAAGLVVSAATGMASATAVALLPVLQTRFASGVLILGSFFAAQYGGQALVQSRSAASQWAGFAVGAVFQGIAMGYLLLAALAVGAGLGNPLLLIGQAFGLVSLTTIGLVAYLWTGPRELSMVRAGLAMVSLPMLVLMAVSFVWPIGGTLGLLLSGAFVIVSVAGLLQRLQAVMHELRTDEVVPGAYLLTMGVLILFWNLLSLLMRLNRR